MTHVDVEGHPHERNGVVWARGLQLEVSEQLTQALVVLSTGREVPDVEPLAPALEHVLDGDELLELLARRLTPRPVVGPLLLHLGAAEDERLRSFRIRRREEHRHRPAFRHALEHRAPGADLIHDRADVVHPLFERADAHAV